MAAFVPAEFEDWLRCESWITDSQGTHRRPYKSGATSALAGVAVASDLENNVDMSTRSVLKGVFWLLVRFSGPVLAARL